MSNGNSTAVSANPVASTDPGRVSGFAGRDEAEAIDLMVRDLQRRVERLFADRLRERVGVRVTVLGDVQALSTRTRSRIFSWSATPIP